MNGKLMLVALMCFILGGGCAGEISCNKNKLQPSSTVDWNKEFEPGETLAFSAEEVTMDASCTFVTVHTKNGDFKAEIPVIIHDANECLETWKNHVMKWDSDLKTHSGFDDDRIYITRLEDYQRPDAIIVDIRDGSSSIQAMLVDDWINNGLAVPKIPIPSGGANYGDSLLFAKTYDTKGAQKDSPKPQFKERDLVTNKEDPGIVWQIISKNFAENGKDIYGRPVGFDNGWYYDCLAILGSPYAGKESNHFRYIAESELTRYKGESQ